MNIILCYGRNQKLLTVQIDKKDNLIAFEETTKLKDCLAILILLHHIFEFMDCAAVVYPVRLGHCFVAMFFFISGYGLRKSLVSKDNYLKGFLYRRILKTYSPFAVATVLYVVARNAVGIRYSIVEIFKSLVGLYTIVNFSWFIFEIIILYIMFYISYKFLGAHQELVLSILCCVFIVTTFVLKLDSYWYVSTLAFPVGVLFSKDESALRSVFFRKSWFLLVYGTLFFFSSTEGLWIELIVKNDLLTKLISRLLAFVCSLSFCLVVCCFLSRITVFNKQRIYRGGVFD